MKRQMVSGIMLILLLIGMLTLAFNIQPVRASGTIYIRADGSIDPPTAPIQRHGNLYVLTGNISSSIVIQKSNITVEGDGYSVQGSQSGNGFDLTSISNVTITNTNIMGFMYGIMIHLCSKCKIIGNNVTQNLSYGIYLFESSNCSVTRNRIESNSALGIELFQYSNFNILYANEITHNIGTGVELDSHSDYNYIVANNITNQMVGISLSGSSSNLIYHDNFQNSFRNALPSPSQVWDNGYPSGGNYWSDYPGTDDNGDGIGDTPYVIDQWNQDNYPLMLPWTGQSVDISVVNVTPSKTVVAQGQGIKINVTVADQGNFPETFNVTVYANTTTIATQTVTLVKGSSTTITFTWNTKGFVYGNYTLWAYVLPIMGEIDTADNTFIYGIVKVTIQGDVDGDFHVTILDVVKITSIYASKEGDPRFNPNSDLDGDGRITILDVVTCTSHYGQKYP
jgi:parallel beta-helix repeat protein